MYDWTVDEIEDYISTNSETRIVYIEYQYNQLGFGEAWFKRTCQTVLNNPLKIKREIFLQRMRGSSQSPFDQEDLEALQELVGKIKEERFLIGKLFKLDIYEELRRDRIYIVGVDVSNGYGEDNSAVTIIDPYTLRCVAEFKSPYISVVQFTNFLYVLVRKHIPKAILCIERNANGESIIDSLKNSPIHHNLYYDNSKDFIASQIDDKLDPDGFLKREAARRKMYGVWTGPKPREQMMSLLDAHIRDFKERFVCKNLIDDILSLVRNKRGKIEAAPGFHDDSVMSYLIGLYVYYHGNNLHRYGFVKGDIPDDEQANKGLTYEEVMQELPEETKQYFEDFSVQTQNDYDAKFVEEIRAAQKQMRHADVMIRSINHVEIMEEESEDSEIPLDFFDELNN